MGTMSGDQSQRMIVDRQTASRTLDNQVGAEDSHAANPDTGLGGTIGSSEAGEDNGGRAAQRTKEGLKSSSQLSIPEMGQAIVVGLEERAER